MTKFKISDLLIALRPEGDGHPQGGPGNPGEHLPEHPCQGHLHTCLYTTAGQITGCGNGSPFHPGFVAALDDDDLQTLKTNLKVALMHVKAREKSTK